MARGRCPSPSPMVSSLETHAYSTLQRQQTRCGLLAMLERCCTNSVEARECQTATALWVWRDCNTSIYLRNAADHRLQRRNRGGRRGRQPVIKIANNRISIRVWIQAADGCAANQDYTRTARMSRQA